MAYMFKRHPLNFEGKNSRIEWEKADTVFAEKLRAAIRRDSAFGTLFGRIVVGAMVLFPLLFVVFFLVELRKSAPFYFAIPFLSVPGFFIGIFLFGALMQVPFLHRKVYPNIWIFHSKCVQYTRTNSPRGVDTAAFHKSGQKIYVALHGEGYKFDPVGKDYIFYKFNDRRGNRWQVVQAAKVGEC